MANRPGKLWDTVILWYSWSEREDLDSRTRPSSRRVFCAFPTPATSLIRPVTSYTQREASRGGCQKAL